MESLDLAYFQKVFRQTIWLSQLDFELVVDAQSLTTEALVLIEIGQIGRLTPIGRPPALWLEKSRRYSEAAAKYQDDDPAKLELLTMVTEQLIFKFRLELVNSRLDLLGMGGDDLHPDLKQEQDQLKAWVEAVTF